MADILSQDEIDNLLSALSTGESAGTELTSEPKKMKRVKTYDFNRPKKFSKDQINTLQMLSETFTRLLTTSISGILRHLVQIHVVSVDQLTYEEFIRSIPNPTVYSILEMTPLTGQAILEIDPVVAFAMIDRMFGGGGRPGNPKREISEIEISVMEGVFKRMFLDLREAWSNIIDLKPSLTKVDSNPQFASIVAPKEMVILITMEVKIGEVEGISNLCIPTIIVDPIAEKLSAQYIFSTVKNVEDEVLKDKLNENLKRIRVPVTVEVGRTTLKVREILQLNINDVVMLNSKYTSELIVKVGNKPKFRGKPGKVGNKLGVVVTGSIDEDEY